MLWFCSPFVSFLPCLQPSSFYRWIPTARTTLIWIRAIHSFVLLAQCQPDRRAGYRTPVISHCTEEPLKILFSFRRGEGVHFSTAVNLAVCFPLEIWTFYRHHFPYRLASLLWFCSCFAPVLLLFCLHFAYILLPHCFLLLQLFAILFRAKRECIETDILTHCPYFVPLLSHLVSLCTE